MDYVWGFIGLAIIAVLLILAIIFLPFITIPLLVIFVGAIAFSVYRFKRTKRIVNDGRLTHEIVDFLKCNDRYKHLVNFTIKAGSVSVELDFKADKSFKSFPLAKKLSSNEMTALASCVCEQIDKDRFEIKHYDASEGGSYAPEIGSIDGKTIYGKTEYYDASEEFIVVKPKVRTASFIKTTSGSNW